MLYIIGGASRSGKTTAAKKVLQQAGIPYFSLDYLMMGIANGIPEFGVNPNEGDYITGQRLWTIVNPLMTAKVENEIDYTIEGVQLLPQFISQFEQRYSGKVRSCFIGLADINIEDSMEAMKYHSGKTENDGFKNLDETETYNQIMRIKIDSIRIREECEQYKLPYFESSNQFINRISSVVIYLLAGRLS